MGNKSTHSLSFSVGTKNCCNATKRPCRDSSFVYYCKKDLGLLGRGRGRLTSPADRQKALKILAEEIAAGARASELAKLMGVGLTTLQRWRREFKADGNGVDPLRGMPMDLAYLQ